MLLWNHFLSIRHGLYSRQNQSELQGQEHLTAQMDVLDLDDFCDENDFDEDDFDENDSDENDFDENDEDY